MIRRLLILSVLALAAGWQASAQLGPGQPAPPPPAGLDGTWNLLSVIEDGRLVPMELVKQTMIRDGRVWVRGGFVAFNRPDGSPRNMPVTLNPAANPMTIDLAAAQTSAVRGSTRGTATHC